jgi:hypothetical protein
MHRVDGPGATGTNQFTKGNPGLGIAPTQVTDEWCNAVQNELEGTIVTGGGLALNKPDNTQLLQAIRNLTAPLPVRQTVLTASVDANGLANFLSPGSGLNLAIDADPSPIRIAFAAGFDAFGPVDRIGSIIADTTLLLTASQTSYVYADRNPATGAITLGSSLLVPVYGYVHPGAPATDQHSFLIHKNELYRWSGAAWVAMQRVFLGEAVTSGAAVTSAVAYALRGRTVLTSAALAANQVQTLAHRIGLQPTGVRAFPTCLITEQGWAVGDDLIQAPNFLEGANSRLWQAGVDRNNVITATDATAPMIMHKTTTGSNVAITFANWGIKAIVERGW